jgi:hypothetical protein
MSNLGNSGSNGFGFNGKRNSNGNGNSNEPPAHAGGFQEESDDHEHHYVGIMQTANIEAYEELVHQIITLEFHDRGLTLDFSAEEAEELGQILVEVMAYFTRKRAAGQ